MRCGYAAVSLALLISGAGACSTARTVSFVSDPAGAEIVVDGRAVGHAPLDVAVPGRWIYQGESARHTVTARAPGLQAGVYYLEPTEVFIPGAVTCLLLVGCPWVAQIPDSVNLQLQETGSR